MLIRVILTELENISKLTINVTAEIVETIFDLFLIQIRMFKLYFWRITVQVDFTNRDPFIWDELKKDIYKKIQDWISSGTIMNSKKYVYWEWFII